MPAAQDGPEIRPRARARRVQDAELVGLHDQERRRRNPALLDERRQLRHLIAARERARMQQCVRA